MKEEEQEIPKLLKGLERRRHIRLSLMGLGSLTCKGGEPQEVYMVCIGRGGAGLYSHEKLDSNQLVVLSLTIPSEDNRQVEVKYAARLRYSQPVGALHMIGLKFEKMSDDRYAFLLRHLKMMKDLQL